MVYFLHPHLSLFPKRTSLSQKPWSHWDTPLGWLVSVRGSPNRRLSQAISHTGKWHLGINNHTNSDGVFLPFYRGFDEVGHILPFSNHWACDESGRHEKQGPDARVCMLYHNTTIGRAQIQCMVEIGTVSFLLVVCSTVQQPFEHANLTRIIARYVLLCFVCSIQQ